LIISTIVISNILNNEDKNFEIDNEISIDWANPPCSPNELNSSWIEITHPLKKENTNDREFQNIKTKEIIEFHPNNSQGVYLPHWHRHNLLPTSRFDYYLDKDGNGVGKDSKKSHIYTNC